MIRRGLDLLQGTLIRRALGLGIGAAIGQASVLAATPLLARMYDKSDFGVLAVVLAVTGVSVVVSSLRYDQAIVVAESDEEASAVVKTAFGFSLLTVILAGVAALAGGNALAEWTNTPDLGPVMWLVPPTIAAGAVHQILVSWATRRGAFRPLSQTKAAVGIGLSASQITLGLLFDGPIGLVAGLSVAWLIGIVFLLPAATGMTLATDRAAWSAAVRYRRFPEFSLLAALLNRGALEIPAVALAALHGPEVAGAFLLANRMVATPARLVTEAAYQVYVNQASELLRDEPAGLRFLFGRTIRRMALLCVAPSLALILVGPTLLVWVFGDEWADAGSYVPMLAILLVAMLLTQPVAATLWLLERQDLQLLREVIRVSLVIAGFLVAWRLDFGASGAVLAYVVAMVAGYGVLLVMCRAVLLRVHERHSAPVSVVA